MKPTILKLICIFSFPLIVSAQPELRTFIDSLAGRHLIKNHGMSLIIGVNKDGQEHIYYYGMTAPASMEHPDSTSVFEVGQISSVFTSILFSDMVIKEQVVMDDPLQNYLPVEVPTPVYQDVICQPMKDAEDPYGLQHDKNKKFTPYVCVPNPQDKPQPILLFYLATHTSGLPPYPLNLKSPKGKNNPYAQYTKPDLYQFLSNYKLTDPIGFDYKPSDLGIALLGHALSLKAGIDYEKLVTENVLQPIGMYSTKINLPEEQMKYFLNGYSENGKATNHWTYDILAPSGAFHSTIGDMMKFLSVNIGTKDLAIRKVLDFSHNPRIRLSSGKWKGSEVALGWLVSPLPGTENKFVWAAGKTGGFASFIGFVETNKTGVVVLSNCAYPVDDLGVEVLKLINH